jgi:uncharacterized protein (DUF433 family)
MVVASTEHIEIVRGAGGPKPRIAGSRIRVQDVVIWHEHRGMSVDEIIEQFPDISRADVYAALAYYWDHKDEIDARISADEDYIDEFLRDHHEPIEARIAAKQRADAATTT